MPRALFRDPFVVNAVEVAKSWAIGVRDGLLQTKVLAAAHRGALGLPGAARPRTRCTDPAQAAVLSLARAGCRLAKHDLLVDYRQRGIDLTFFAWCCLAGGARVC